MTPREFESATSRFVDVEGLPKPPARIGVALSGGADSVALLLALDKLGYDVVALHCNFALRGEESDADTAFCVDLCRDRAIEIETVIFATSQARRGGESIEMACRRLRYDWFADRLSALSLEAIALGHHREDSSETLMINLFRGTGLKGLVGIASARDCFFRPLLWATRAQIEEYLVGRGQSFRVDSTNLTDDYRRNALRNIILPQADRYFGDTSKGIATTARRVGQASRLLDSYVVADLENYLAGQSLDVAKLRRDDPMLAPQKLYHFAQRLWGDINETTATDIISSTEKSGLAFSLADGRRLELSRGILSLRNDAPHPTESFAVDISKPITAPLSIDSRIISPQQFLSADKTGRTAFFDASIFDGDPVFELRHWTTGDRLEPFGMTGSRLLSDIFKDLKFDAAQKRAQWVLTRDGTIIWIPGIRASRHFRVTPSTMRVVALSI